MRGEPRTTFLMDNERGRPLVRPGEQEPGAAGQDVGAQRLRLTKSARNHLIFWHHLGKTNPINLALVCWYTIM